ncbi:hypothetical protein MLC52_09835 [Sulfurimonas sp. NW15]|uniref:hypothetical protein n=1 Tax=Sulfurimonas TaxID=202746 RepID=UPI00125F7490|nr:hypothetical protein [Sulfurimonas hydrogeniphila]
MIQISTEELLESLKLGYIEYKECLAIGSDNVDLAHIKGYCTTLEQILIAYGNISKETILEIRKPIIGDVSLRRKKRNAKDIDYDVPTILRKQLNYK